VEVNTPFGVLSTYSVPHLIQ